MGMTIDEALGYMPCLMEACSHCLVKGCDKPIEKIDEAKLMAIETMRKYEKVKDIYYHQSGEALENSLRAVIEDGKID